MKKQLLLVFTVCCVFAGTAFTSIEKPNYAQNKSKTSVASSSSGFIVHHGVFSTEGTDLHDYNIEFSFNMATQEIGFVKITQVDYPYCYVYGTKAAGDVSSNMDGTGLLCSYAGLPALLTYEFPSFSDPCITVAIYFTPGDNTPFDY